MLMHHCGFKGWTRQWWTDAWDGTCSASTGWHCHYSVSAIPLRRLRAYQMHALEQGSEQGRWDALSALGQETQADLRRFGRDHRGWRRDGDWSHQYNKNSTSWGQWGEDGFDGGGELGHETLCRSRRGGRRWAFGMFVRFVEWRRAVAMFRTCRSQCYQVAERWCSWK